MKKILLLAVLILLLIPTMAHSAPSFWSSLTSSITYPTGCATNGVFYYDGSAWQCLTPTNSSVLGYNSSGTFGAYTTLALPPEEYVITTDTTLSETQVTNSFITNYGQINNFTLTLPSATKSYNFILTLGTASGTVSVATGGNSVYVDGTVATQGVRISVPAVGAYITAYTFKTGTSTWAWNIIKGKVGTWYLY